MSNLLAGDIIYLKETVITQGIGVTITYGLDKGHKIPVLVLPTEAVIQARPEIQRGLEIIRKALS